MITLNIITPAKDRTGAIVPSYSKDRNGNSLVKTGVSHSKEEFDTIKDAHKFMHKHPDNAYEIIVG